MYIIIVNVIYILPYIVMEGLCVLERYHSLYVEAEIAFEICSDTVSIIMKCCSKIKFPNM